MSRSQSWMKGRKKISVLVLRSPLLFPLGVGSANNTRHHTGENVGHS